VQIDRYIKVRNIDIRYWQAGESGAPLILLHGGSGSVEFWSYNIDNLARSYRVYAFDTIGSGRSGADLNSDYSIVDQARFLGELMDVFNLPSANLIGNSMGGIVALQFALMHPDRVSNLVLVAAMGFGSEIDLGIRLTTLPGVINSIRPGRWMIPLMLRSNFYNVDAITPAWIESRYAVFALPGRNQAVKKLVNTNFNLAGVRPEIYQPILSNLDRIACPSLVIWGEQDRIIPVKHAYIASDRLPNSQLHIFERCGHHPHLEYARKFEQIVLNFLGMG
jgi:pimeloyl-ACP methyl ester carboxylesterase